MPLKKSGSSQNDKNSGKENIDSFKKTNLPDKESEFEYICKVYFHYNTVKKKQEYAIMLKTVKLFSTLNYILSVEAKKVKNSIDIAILGIKPETKYLNEANHAAIELFFNDLYGKHTINIIKQDGSINSAIFDFNVFKKNIVLLEEFLKERENNRKFCKFEVDKEKFTFSREGLS